MHIASYKIACFIVIFFQNKILHRISYLRLKFSRNRGRSFFPRKFLPLKYFQGESKKKLISTYVIYINFLLLGLSQHLYQFKLFYIIFSSPMRFYIDKHFSLRSAKNDYASNLVMNIFG